MRTFLLLLTLLPASAGCRILADHTPCVSDDNCVLAERCSVTIARCVPRTVEADAGVRPPDAGAPPSDAGLDGGAPPLDAGGPPADGGLDGGTPPVDGGHDAGAPPGDAGFDAGAPPVDAGPPDFLQRQRFDIATAGLLGDLSDFPLPLDLSGVGTSVGDFEVRTPGGQPLAVEVERADPLFVWVRLPTLAAGNTGAHVWVYFDNAGPAVEPTGAVWDDGYLAVFHCADDVTAVASAHDSSGKDNDGLLQGTWNADDVVAGRAGAAFELDGTSQWLNLGTGPEVTPEGPFTVEVWYRIRAPGPGNSYIVTRTGFEANRGFDLSFNDYGGDDSWIEWRTYTDGSNGNGASEAKIAVDAWQYAVGTFAGGEAPALYLDGAVAVTAAAAWPADASLYASTQPLAIGSRPDVAGYVPGAIDEVRLSATRRSDAYIHATHLALTGALVTAGVVEALQ